MPPRFGFHHACALLVITVIVAACSHGSSPAPTPAAPRNMLAATPPMGWNSWNRFQCKIDENLIHETADAMVKSGMKAAGYQYINIDDCWMAKTRDAQGNLQPDPVRFSHGIKALADYVHSKGLKLGIYSSAGTGTCENFPASLDHEVADANTFASWGIDYLKYDNCNNQKRPFYARYDAMAKALRATGRPIVFSLCEWGENKPWEWGRQVGGQLWRTTGDISDRWGSMLSILDKQVGLEKYSGPGGWNDPDMLEVGNGRMSYDEYVAHFSLWALLNAPLISGNDLRSMSDSTRGILTNKDVIAVDQDWGGMQGTRVRKDSMTQVWAKPMRDGSKAVVLLNRGEQPVAISVTATELGLRAASSYAVRDLWTKAQTTTPDKVTAQVPRHGAAMFVIKAR
jgi:alpha-galactosidase